MIASMPRKKALNPLMWRQLTQQEAGPMFIIAGMKAVEFDDLGASGRAVLHH
jgi:hypothetical protein